MSLETQGFLSPELEKLKTLQRQKHAEPFGLLDQASELGQQALSKVSLLKPTTDNLLASIFFVRGLQTVQGAILMLERGMILEARTLSRGAIETLFYLGSATKDPTFSQDFFRDHIYRVDKLAKAHERIAVAPEDDHNKLKTAIESARDIAGEGRSMAISDAARRANMMNIYEGFYRGLSTDSAHPTVMSISSHWDKDADDKPCGILWGPEVRDDDALLDTIFVVVLVNLLLIDTLNELTKDEQIERNSHELSRVYLRLKGHTVSEELDQARPEQLL